MKKCAVIFPGFGFHNMKFLKLYFKKYNLVQKTFEEASCILNYNIYESFLKNKKNSIYYYNNLYLLIFTSSIAIYKLLIQESDFTPKIMAGHSLGQYSALVCNKNILFTDALKIIKIRHDIMLMAVKDTRILNLIIIGLNYRIIDKFCKFVSNKKKVFISIINSNTQVVITGHYSLVYTTGQIFKKQMSARVIKLPMLISPHCPLIKHYKKKFSYYLKKIKIVPGKSLIISNHNANIISSPKKIYSSLLKQLYTTVQWHNSIKKIMSSGIDIIIESGPGEILTNLNPKNKKILFYSTCHKKSLSLTRETIKKL
ncbi:ACP S-malonyltransferase [Buchnera aphidicola]|uniref:Malonyl CoA-acyl carrier protein transacylase n=1 Tax=Buchnera aphidicola (Cinara strobi) TaxID=1921549 RepID=A0A3B1E0P9_9GAMM|nr:acyltransferase domain-containing protein [Buchnera aphidicola]VAX76595.1 Malonyl CoA-acyl carrier protein transacylase [Buchnera aphidicola (Cinara strobi)]